MAEEDRMDNMFQNAVISAMNSMSHDTVLSNVQAKLIPSVREQELIDKNAIYSRYLDLLITYYVPLDLGVEDQTASIVPQKAFLEKYGISEEELAEAALANISYTLQPMADVLLELAGIEQEESIPMYILSNEKRLHGASSILSEKALAEAAELLGDTFTILPSSVHELILIPGECDVNLAEMVREINDTMVAPHERLSYFTYLYKDGKVGINRRSAE